LNGLPPSRRRLLVAAWWLLTLGLAVRAFADGALALGERGAPPPWRPVRIDINRAPIAELMALPGIGSERAEAIVLRRIRRGPFGSLEELAGVGGIGSEALRQLRPHAFAGPR
jgi:competence protein ComEA